MTALVVLGIIAIVVGVFFFEPWILMLVLGGLSHMFNVPALAIGFWPCVLISILLNIIGSAFRSSHGSTD